MVQPPQAYLWRLEDPGSGRRATWLTPPRLLSLAFLALIAAGTLGMKLIPGLYVGPGLSWLDALFTATSAVCVTGLVVVDTATYFTPLGQAYLLVLIQLGGLGILTLTTLVILALGRRLSFRHHQAAASSLEAPSEVRLRDLVKRVVLLTLGVEALGSLGLWILWRDRFPGGEAAWHAVFQAVSAFCNAGFTTFEDSLVGFRTSPAVLGVVMALIVVGGLGFLTLEEVRRLWRGAEGPRRPLLSLHSKLVLGTTALLAVGGAAMYAGLEWTGVLAGMHPAHRAVNSLFMSVTARTAGFNSVDYGSVGHGTGFLTVLLMMVGGSPGSTAGGLKTTTVALVLLMAWSRVRGQGVTSLAGRSVPDETLHQAIGLVVLATAVMVVGVLLLTSWLAVPTGGGGFLAVLFEVASAFNTVGLSMGLTPELTGGGKLALVVLMYVGRVGVLALAAAVSSTRPRRDRFRFAFEQVAVG